MKTSRRQFMILSAAGACTLALNNQVQAQAMVAETDPQAAALGYKADASKVEKKPIPWGFKGITKPKDEVPKEVLEEQQK